MPVETKIYALLIANATINRKVNTRVFPIVIPQDSELPAITYQRISAQKITSLSGYSNLENSHILINSWATKYETVKALAEDIHSVMDNSTGFKTVLSNELDAFDPEAGLWAVSQDFSCWDQEV